MSAPMFALVAGLFYVAFGLLAQVGSLSIAEGEPPIPYFLGLFGVALLLNALHAALGVWGLLAWSGILSAVSYARALAAITGVLALAGLVTTHAALPLHGHNVWLHGLTAAAAAWIGFRSFARAKVRSGERRGPVANRRLAQHRVAYERRRGVLDRRLSAA